MMRKIYVNPNFKHFDRDTYLKPLPRTSVAINPSLFRQNIHDFPPISSFPASSIHMNPAFFRNISWHGSLHSERQSQQHLQIQQPPYTSRQQTQLETQRTSTFTDNRKILTKSRTCIIREPAPKSLDGTTNPKSSQTIVKLTTRNLVRPHESSITTMRRYVPPVVVSPMSWSKRYKLDRTATANKATINTSLRLTLRQTTVVNRTKKLLNINGVMYKVSPNSLARRPETSPMKMKYLPTAALSKAIVKARQNAAAAREKGGKVFLVGGDEYVMDSSGYKITRRPAMLDNRGVYVKNNNKTDKPKLAATSPSSPRYRRRLDIGGLTFVASTSKRNVFVRTQSHLAKAHLAIAKHRSLNVLSRRYSKRNEPCPIYKRLGVCLGNIKGTCNKLHDKDLVIICPKFLRGACTNRNCLLSHNVSLSKMPVCRFYLQGNCSNGHCPFLHKKLSKKVELCEQFLRGYCKLADQCNKRHEFKCPNIDRNSPNGECKTSNCLFCKKTNRCFDKQHLDKPEQKTNEEATANKCNSDDTTGERKSKTTQRYFKTHTVDDETTPPTDDENESKPAKRAHDSRLDENPNEPSFIPI